MKIIRQDLCEDDEDQDGVIEFIMGDYYYYILEMDGDLSGIMRQTIEQYEQNSDEWEYPSWGKSELQFKFLKR